MGKFTPGRWSFMLVFDAADGMHGGVVPESGNITSQFGIIWQVRVVLPAFVGPVVMIWVG